MGMARAASVRGDCTRSQVGAVVVKNQRIVGSGYNGTKPGRSGCLEGVCPRGKHYAVRSDPDGWVYHKTFCGGCGHDWPCPSSVDPGSSYDTGPGACIAVHAEISAILDCDRDDRAGAVLYVTREPCPGCRKIIEVSGIEHVHYDKEGAIIAWAI